ncbi:hypothetical protein BIV23_37255 [Streptomyces monashensis]|uniref:Major facilitator superfamily (MFS) profile domain-containing protein n=2 Tax=Streptomyces monashensis TaxID=1678012 RepID=A0A1S2PJ12_9ACTN|nr:hypothetical protein BIV23_37255 [Streptomyces monashensis]
MRISLIAGCVLLSSTSFYMNFVLVPLYLLSVYHGHDASLLTGLVSAASFLVSAFVSPVWGRLSDRFGPKAMMLRSGVLLTVVYALFPLCHSPWQILGIRVVNGLASGFIPAAFAMAAKIVRESQAARAMSALSAARSAGALAGPALCGVGVATIGFTGTYVCTAAVMGVGALLTAFALPQIPGEGRTARSLNPFAPLFAVSVRNGLGTPLLVSFVSACVVSCITLLVPLFLTQTLHSSHSAEFTGTMFLVGGGIALGMAGVWGTLADRYGFERSLGAGLAGACLGVLVMSIASSVTVFAVGYVVTITFSCEFGTMLMVWLTHTQVGREARGLVLGTNNSLTLLGAGLGPLLAGGLTQGVGTRFMLIVSALLLAACLVAALAVWSLQSRRAPVERGPVEADAQ